MDYCVTAGKQVSTAPCEDVAMKPDEDVRSLISHNLMSYIKLKKIG